MDIIYFVVGKLKMDIRELKSNLVSINQLNFEMSIFKDGRMGEG